MTAYSFCDFARGFEGSAILPIDRGVVAKVGFMPCADGFAARGDSRELKLIRAIAGAGVPDQLGDGAAAELRIRCPLRHCAAEYRVRRRFTAVLQSVNFHCARCQWAILGLDAFFQSGDGKERPGQLTRIASDEKIDAMLLSRLKHLKGRTREHPTVDNDAQQRTQKLQPLSCGLL